MLCIVLVCKTNTQIKKYIIVNIIFNIIHSIAERSFDSLNIGNQDFLLYSSVNNNTKYKYINKKIK